jgi:hypothetical protein
MEQTVTKAYAIYNTKTNMWEGRSWEEKSLHRAKFYQSLENAELNNPEWQRQRLNHIIVEVELKVIREVK